MCNADTCVCMNMALFTCTCILLKQCCVNVNLGSGFMMIQLTKTQRGNIIICTTQRCLLPLFNV